MPIDQSFISLKFGLSFLGLLFIVLGWIAYHVGVRKAINPFVGFRIPPTYRNPEVWRAVNIRTGILFALHGIFMTISGIVLPKVEFWTFLLILLLPLAGMIIYGTLYAYQLEQNM